jgi:hypothetical protein
VVHRRIDEVVTWLIVRTKTGPAGGLVAEGGIGDSVDMAGGAAGGTI